MTESGRIKFVERRKLYPDHGIVADQTLVSQTKDSLIIYDSEILEISGQRIKLKLYTDRSRNANSFLIGYVDLEALDGFLME